MTRKRTSAVGGAMMLAVAGPAVAQGSPDTMQNTRLAEACGIEMRLSEAGCRCVADRAMGNLTDLQRDYLLATVIAPGAAHRMRAKISHDDMQTLARFLASAEQECAAE
jgi:hypothetical protein